MRASGFRRWSFVHKWTSLICTAFLLWLCVTGLPLIFHHEIDHLLHEEVEPADAAGRYAARRSRPRDRAGTRAATRSGPCSSSSGIATSRTHTAELIGKAPDPIPPEQPARRASMRARRSILDEPDFTQPADLHPPAAAHRHVRGPAGQAVPRADGAAVRRRDRVRRRRLCAVHAQARLRRRSGAHRPPRIKWLDLHNLLGIVTLTWALVVGCHRRHQHLGRPRHQDLAVRPARRDGRRRTRTAAAGDNLALGASGDAAPREAAPDMTPSFIAFPGTLFSSKHHYAVFLRGDTPLTSRLLKPVLVDAADRRVHRLARPALVCRRPC